MFKSHDLLRNYADFLGVTVVNFSKPSMIDSYLRSKNQDLTNLMFKGLESLIKLIILFLKLNKYQRTYENKNCGFTNLF